MKKFFLKLKLAWKGREILGQVTQAAAGYKTLSFWVTLLGSLITYMAALKEIIPPTAALVITSVLVAVYNVARGVEKGGLTGVKPWYKTTEFWLGLGGQASNAMVTIQTGGVSTDTLVKANGILTALMVFGNSLATVPPATPTAAEAAALEGDPKTTPRPEPPKAE